MTTIKLTLLENGKKVTHTQNFIPLGKKLEYIEKEAELLENKEETKGRELLDFQIDFIASLFDKKEVTREKILNGLSIEDEDTIMNIILAVLGVNMEDLNNSKKEK